MIGARNWWKSGAPDHNYRQHGDIVCDARLFQIQLRPKKKKTEKARQQKTRVKNFFGPIPEKWMHSLERAAK